MWLARELHGGCFGLAAPEVLHSNTVCDARDERCNSGRGAEGTRTKLRAYATSVYARRVLPGLRPDSRAA
jgi:hypothetical protein